MLDSRSRSVSLQLVRSFARSLAFSMAMRLRCNGSGALGGPQPGALLSNGNARSFFSPGAPHSCQRHDGDIWIPISFNLDALVYLCLYICIIRANLAKSLWAARAAPLWLGTNP